MHCKNLRVVLTSRSISVAHSINILSVIGMFLLLWPHNCLLMRYTWWLSISQGISGQSKRLILTGCLLLATEMTREGLRTTLTLLQCTILYRNGNSYIGLYYDYAYKIAGHRNCSLPNVERIL